MNRRTRAPRPALVVSLALACALVAVPRQAEAQGFVGTSIMLKLAGITVGSAMEVSSVASTIAFLASGERQTTNGAHGDRRRRVLRTLPV